MPQQQLLMRALFPHQQATGHRVAIRGKRFLATLMLWGMGMLTTTSWAEPPAPTQLPTGEQVVGGHATFNRTPATLNIDQHTSRAAIDWQAFDIGSQAAVNFRQPSPGSVTLNRILGSQSSQIFGQLNANGQVYLSNPNGIYFAPGSSVNVGGLVATTHSLSLEDFMAGRDHFTRNGATGRIINEGQLKAALGGYIALLAPEVRNHGVIIAELGTVALAAGEAFELQFDPDRQLTGLRIDPATIDTLVENRQAVLTPDGLIILSAQGADQLQGSVVRNDGHLEASSLVAKGGRILLEGDDITLGATSTIVATGATGGGEVLVGGDWQGSGDMNQATTVTMEVGATMDVSATNSGDGGKAVLWSDVANANSVTAVHGEILARGGANGGNGGQIETSGNQVDIAGVLVNTLGEEGNAGLWLIDPTDINISVADGTTYSTNLNSTDVTIATLTGEGTDGAHISFDSGATINNASGSTRTLTLKAAGGIFTHEGSITSSSGALNVVLWADADGGMDQGIHTGTISTNGGGLWMGGGSGSTTWTPFDGATAITVGDSYAGGHIDHNLNAIDLSGNLSTGGGHVLLKGTTSQALGTDIAAQNGGILIDAGSGNITLMQDEIAYATNDTLTLQTTGALTIAPLSNTFDTAFTWAGSGSPNFTGSGTVNGLVINDIANLTGLTIGKTTNDKWVNINDALAIAGPISVYGGNVTVRNNIASTGTGDITLSAQASFRSAETAPVYSITNSDGDIYTLADSNANGNGYLVLDYLTFNAGSDDLIFRGENFFWNGTKPRLNGTGTITIESSDASFGQELRTSWFDFDQDANSMADVTLGKSTNTQNIFLDSAMTAAGTIAVYGSNIAITNVLTATGINTVTISGSGTVTDGASGYVVADKLALLDGAVTFDHTSNDVNTIAGGGLDSLTFIDADDVIVGSVNPDGITASGAINVRTLSGDLTISENISGSAVVLNADSGAAAGTSTGGNIILSGSPTITATSGNAILYTGSISGSTGLTSLIGSGSGNFRYNSDESATNFSLGLGTTGNYAVYREHPSISVTVTNETITYGSTPTLATTVSGSQNGDTSGQIFSATPSVAVGGSTSTSGNHIAGAQTLTPSGGTDQLGYAISGYINGTLTVDQKALTYTGTANNKTYDQLTSATLTNSATGVVSGDVISITSSGTFADKHVGTGKFVSISGITLSGADALNYSLANTASSSADITAKAVTVSGLTANHKIYDANTSATVVSSGVTFTGLIGGDNLTVASASGTFADKHVGTGKTVTLSGLTYGGTDAGNYSFTDQASTTANITPKAITVSGITANNKVYDGQTTATLANAGTPLGVITGDTVFSDGSGATASFGDKNVGTGKTVSVTGLALSGVNASNYTIASTDSTTADITRLPSVTWTGGASGNWFDVSNWAGGAVPDLSNVAMVTIPTGVTVTFDDSSVIAPANSGPVAIDSLGTNGNLLMAMGSLGVGSGGVMLNQLTQTGGTFSSVGAITLNEFLQSGGATSTQDDFTVTQNFSQTGTGTVTATGSIALTDTSGGLTFGNLTSGGPLTATSTNGSITQTSGTALIAYSTSSFTASNSGMPADILLPNSGNDFQGVVTLNGATVNIVDGNGGMTLGTVVATGPLMVAGDLASQAMSRQAQAATDAASSQGTQGVVPPPGSPETLPTYQPPSGNGANSDGGANSVVGTGKGAGGPGDGNGPGQGAGQGLGPQKGGAKGGPSRGGNTSSGSGGGANSVVGTGHGAGKPKGKASKSDHSPSSAPKHHAPKGKTSKGTASKDDHSPSPGPKGKTPSGDKPAHTPPSAKPPKGDHAPGSPPSSKAPMSHSPKGPNKTTTQTLDRTGGTGANPGGTANTTPGTGRGAGGPGDGTGPGQGAGQGLGPQSKGASKDTPKTGSSTPPSKAPKSPGPKDKTPSGDKPTHTPPTAKQPKGKAPLTDTPPAKAPKSHSPKGPNKTTTQTSDRTGNPGANPGGTANTTPGTGRGAGQDPGPQSKASSGDTSHSGSGQTGSGGANDAEGSDSKASTNDSGLTQGLIIDVLREITDNDSGVISVSIPKELIQGGDTITFKLPEAIQKSIGSTRSTFTKLDGQPLPRWLRYETKQMQFRITNTSAAKLPIQMIANFAGQQVLITITER